MLACDLDAGINPPVKERNDLREKAYRISRDLTT
jgi:hypothetical protein